jgi:hypothetical protein
MQTISVEEAEEFRAEIADLRRRLAASQRAAAGVFYAPIEDLWETDLVGVDDEDFLNDMRRDPDQLPTDPERGHAGQNSLGVSLQHAAPGNRCTVALMSSRVAWAEEDWPTDAFSTPNIDGELAHLIPHSDNHASTYADVARCILALQDDAGEDIQQTIHGSRRRRRVARALRRRVFRRPPRIPRTGFKHCSLNLIRLLGQKSFFDERPCVIIVPLMTLVQMKDWNLEDYEAIVLAGDYETTPAASAYCGIGATLGPLATGDEIETARESLAQVLRGLAYSLEYRQLERGEHLLPKSMQQLLRSFRRNLHVGTRHGIVIPTRVQARGLEMNVRKISFQAHNPALGTRLNHRAPEPLALIVKSAINWSRRHGQQLLPG